MVYRLVIAPEQIQEQQIKLDAQQLHYLLRVLRLTDGDRFIALNGIGNSWLAEITNRSAIILESVTMQTELSVSLSLITALPKGSGYEEVIKCCTELGVSNFIPVISDRTMLQPSVNKMQRWRKIITEAAEQSERQIVPTLSTPINFSTAINSITSDSSKYICVARENLPSLGSRLTKQVSDSIIIATGCEGGWTEGEITLATSQGFEPVSLGKRILRAITAPIAVSALVAALAGN